MADTCRECKHDLVVAPRAGEGPEAAILLGTCDAKAGGCGLVYWIERSGSRTEIAKLGFYCPVCKGEGAVVDDAEGFVPCARCTGDGFVQMLAFGEEFPKC
jgi:hypothetical protein